MGSMVEKCSSQLLPNQVILCHTLFQWRGIDEMESADALLRAGYIGALRKRKSAVPGITGQGNQFSETGIFGYQK
jgi:O-acetyl-ADP-ribose deacetylase (regulator of RNase III)